MSFCDSVRMTVSLLLWGNRDDSCPDKDLEYTFLFCGRSRGTYWPRNERAMTAVILFSSHSDLWEQRHPIFICVHSGSLTHSLHVLAHPPASSSLPSFLFYFFTTTQPNPPQASSFIHRVHSSRQSRQPFAPAVVYVVSVVTKPRLAWREMRPDCASGGQRGGQLSNVSGLRWESKEIEGNRAKRGPLLWLEGISTCSSHA